MNTLTGRVRIGHLDTFKHKGLMVIQVEVKGTDFDELGGGYDWVKWRNATLADVTYLNIDVGSIDIEVSS